MDQDLLQTLRDLVVVEMGDNNLLGITHVFEIADGGHGPETVVLLRCGETGEVRQECLSMLRDPESYKLFATLAHAKKWVEEQ